jgi:predicted nucleotidyltransferase
MNLLERYADEIEKLCRQYKVKKLAAFGSIVKGGFRQDSDIDLIVDFELMPYKEYADNYFALKFALEQQLGRPVDLLEGKELSNPFFIQQIASYQKTIYAA